MVQMRRLTCVLVSALVGTLLLAGLGQAAPASKAHAHATRSHAKLATAQANSIALKEFPGKVVGKTKLENEEGTWQYGVMVRSGKTLREVMVNANTGKIDSVEVTTAGKEKTEAKAEVAKAAPKVGAKPKPAKDTSHPSSKRTSPHGTK